MATPRREQQQAARKRAGEKVSGLLGAVAETVAQVNLSTDEIANLSDELSAARERRVTGLGALLRLGLDRETVAELCELPVEEVPGPQGAARARRQPPREQPTAA
ncbi:hypothetical protein AB0M43_37810 [Longispora sp. NPDC051575]|uniref:hypothetical protein n=1 Tax=Longispora sp. NPDC051575 TaxID=3154943 RepID=UPI00342A94E0